MATTRMNRRYDHRLRHLVQTTRDIGCAIHRGVPRSTARSWLNAPKAEVVSVDVLSADTLQLQQEVLQLRARVQKLLALLRVLLAVLKFAGYSLTQTRLPDGNPKRALLQAINTTALSPGNCQNG
jgi:hypothetical protein